MPPSTTIIKTCKSYELSAVMASIPDELFTNIKPGSSIVLKPNWVMESHKTRKQDWEYVITHPVVITAVLHKVIKCLSGNGKICILDGPMTEASFEKLISHYPVEDWKNIASKEGIFLDVIDLREHEWVLHNDVVIERKQLPGDPRGKVVVDILDEKSEFFGHSKSRRGYYGADYDRNETNKAHDGHHNLYSVSRTVIESDVFINLPKLKTHRTAGITCCLKNLVGINTYKNYLPHFSEGGPSDNGDQFPHDNINAKIEGPINALLKQNILKYEVVAKRLTFLNTIGKKIFGDSKSVIRNGSWYGNDTMWRMILDLNKVLMYANPDGSLRQSHMKYSKKYIGIVDAVLAGEGEGPLSPDPKKLGYIISGINPVAIDATCAILMGFDFFKIPAIRQAFDVKNFPLCEFTFSELESNIDGVKFDYDKLVKSNISAFVPQHGWKGHIER